METVEKATTETRVALAETYAYLANEIKENREKFRRLTSDYRYWLKRLCAELEGLRAFLYTETRQQLDNRVLCLKAYIAEVLRGTEWLFNKAEGEAWLLDWSLDSANDQASGKA